MDHTYRTLLKLFERIKLQSFGSQFKNQIIQSIWIAYNANACGFEIDMNSLIHDLMDLEV